MIADVPVGAFLSGGIDSSLIVALMSALHPQPVKTFSIGFDAGVSEDHYARLVAERFHTDHHEIRVSSQDLIVNIPAVLHARETPITEASDVAIFLLSRLARTKVTVALSGEGSDEVLAGYPKYAFERAFGTALDWIPESGPGPGRDARCPSASGACSSPCSPPPKPIRSSATPAGSAASALRSGAACSPPSFAARTGSTPGAEDLLAEQALPEPGRGDAVPRHAGIGSRPTCSCAATG